jgi:hypothetical protein
MQREMKAAMNRRTPNVLVIPCPGGNDRIDRGSRIREYLILRRERNNTLKAWERVDESQVDSQFFNLAIQAGQTQF